MLILSPSQPSLPNPFPKGAVFLIDKPLAWTSFDVVSKVRHPLSRRLGMKRAKVGHAGTLDPLATGLLVICVGDYTKRIDELQAQPKEYVGTFTFGATTPSYDLEKAPDVFFPTGHLTDELLQAALSRFRGEIAQLPPAFSAVKVEGKRLYDQARAGRTTEAALRQAHIFEFELGPLRAMPSGRPHAVVAGARGATIMLHPDHQEGIQADFRVVCSKGTYIRSLAHDLGQAVGSGAYLSALRRTRSGGFSVEDAWTVEALAAALREEKSSAGIDIKAMPPGEAIAE